MSGFTGQISGGFIMNIRHFVRPSALLCLFLFLITSAKGTSLEVRVQDNYTARPLHSAWVTLYSDGEEIGSGYTDNRGCVLLSLPAGSDEPPDLPAALALSPNYPNPFQDETRVDMAVPEDQTITVTVYNILGRRVATRQMPVRSGYHTLTMSLGHLATGVYFLRVDGNESRTVSMFRMGSGVHRGGPAFSMAPGRAPEVHGQVPVRTRQDYDASARSGASPETIAASYTIRVEKDRYDTYQADLIIPASRHVTLAISRNNLVEFLVTDTDGAGLSMPLDITSGHFHISINTPETLTLKSGVYRASGAIGSGLKLAHEIEVASVDTTVVLRFDEAGGMLPGEPHARAGDAAYDLDIRILYPGDAVAEDPELLYGGQVLRTEIELIADPAATVGQMNELLDTYDAQIVSMLSDNIIFIIRVPDPGSIDALNNLIDQIRNEPVVWMASKSVIVEGPDSINDANQQPGGIQQIPGHTTSMVRIDHHLAARAHAAWNMRSTIADMDRRPQIVIADYFGDGVPGIGYNASFRNADFATGATSNHGYHVLGIISGMYDPVETLESGPNDVTGMFPERLHVRAVDLADTLLNTWPRRMNQIISTIREIIAGDEQARIVVNTSLNSRNIANQKESAIRWITRIRGENIHTFNAGLETRFVHFTSAGNNRYDNGNIVSWPASDNSMFAYATIRDMLFDNRPVPRLRNTIVIENRVHTGHLDSEEARSRPMPGCASYSSIMGGSLSAMGTDIWSFGDCLFESDGECIVPVSDPRTSYMTGTSMATPQAAGLAAYVWAVNPELSVNDVMDIMFSTSVADTSRNTPGFSCHQQMPKPVIDAYAAVLAGGGENARLALLDVNDDGVFDHHDLRIIIDSLRLRDGALDYSRFDLNGDGFTGGDSTDRFDLDMNSQYTVVWEFIDGEPVSFDESHLTDMDILCYYAWSDLYQGDPDQREESLFGLCREPETDVVIDIDGNVYPIVRAGTQWWMAENLRVSHYRNGDPIPNITDADEWTDLSTGAWAVYYNDMSNDTKYGKLYNWYAVSDPRGLCPVGWHPASRDPGSPYSWSRLSVELGEREVAGEKMKSTHGWIHNGNGTNESGYNGLPGGLRLANGTFSGKSYYGFWWTDTDGFGSRPHEAWYYRLYYGDSEILGRDGDKTAGLSVRCVRQ